MRIFALVRSLFLILALASPVLLVAQFQPPTDEELKMTDEPKAPGTAAVYLFREETTDDTLHYHSYYERIKVLTEKGKEMATVRIPYEHGQFQVTDISGRTIHPDGTIIPLTTKPTDLMDVKSGVTQMNTMVFTLPSVEVGSILEFRLQLRYDDSMVSSPAWMIQQPYYVRKAHYMFKPAATSYSRYITNGRGQALDRLMYAVIGLPLDKVTHDQLGHYLLDVADIPPTPSDDWMPPLNTIKQRVQFYYTYARSGQEFWDAEGKRWAKEAERFTNPKNPIKDALQGIVAPADTDEQKARKIYAAVMKLENTDFTRKKSHAELKAEKIKAIKDAEDVWKQQAGTGDELALLYVALARAAGLKVWPMEVVDRTRAIFDPNFLSAGQLDDYIAIVEIGGNEVFLDPGQKMCPFGILHWKHTIASGFKLADKGAALATTPAGTYKTAVLQRAADINIDPQGAVTGNLRYVMSGPDALYWRQIALENDPDEVKKKFFEYVRDEVPDGVQPEVDHFSGIDDPNVNLGALVKITGSLGTATGKRLFLPGQFFQSHAKHPFVAEAKRITPVDVHFARMEQDNVSYHLPAGIVCESAPQTADLSWPNHALMKVREITKDNQVDIVRAFARNFAMLEPAEYNDIHDFYQKVATADQQQIVLTRAPAPKGN